MRKRLLIVALALSLGGASVSSVAAQPDPCAASEHGLTTAGSQSGEAPSGGVFHGKAQSNEASQHNFCDQP
jgi:hypothetical protein